MHGKGAAPITPPKRSKKTDKIEVRLSPETKQAFLETCEQQGETASGVIRSLVEGYVKRFYRPVLARPFALVRRTPVWARWSATGVATAVMGSVMMMPSQAQSSIWENRFEQLGDVNGDGKIDLGEYHVTFTQKVAITETDAARARIEDYFEIQFAKADTDGDGFIQKAEYVSVQIADMTRRFNQIDTDRDGHLTLDEFASPPLGEPRAFVNGMVFGRIISDDMKIGKVAPSEFTPLPRWEGETPPNQIAVRLGQTFSDLDADNSSGISLEEWLEN